MKYTRSEDARIRAELLRIEREQNPPDAYGEVPLDLSDLPLDMFPSLSAYVTACGHKIIPDIQAEQSEVEQLQETNRQVYRAFAKVSIEARDLRLALRRAECDVVIVGIAGIALLVITILGMRL